MEEELVHLISSVYTDYLPSPSRLPPPEALAHEVSLESPTPLQQFYSCMTHASEHCVYLLARKPDNSRKPREAKIHKRPERDGKNRKTFD